jgi:NadR type nicotinamide-nucleotide adenylyltransferase
MKPIKKVVILGGESTGKSTLCEQLAHYYDTVWVKEYAREYLEKLGRDYIEADLLDIAKGQLLLEKNMLKEAKQFLFCDTDLNVIKVWSEYKYGKCDQFILDEIAKQKYDAYIVTAPDFPWKDDPLREHPEPELREYFFTRYEEIANQSGLPFRVVRGNEEERMLESVAFLREQLLQN